MQPPERTANHAAQALGRLLRDKRDAAGLSRVELARLAKLSDTTLKWAESGTREPSRATLIRLCDIPQLKLRWTELPGHLPAPPRETATPEKTPFPFANWFVAPDLDILALQEELGRQLRGAGGYIEQSKAYLDYESARAFLSLCKQSRDRPRLTEAAQHISKTTKAGLQILSLGSGSARAEVELVRHLSNNSQSRTLDLFLCDISQPLLLSGFVHASKNFTESEPVRVWSVHCDFQQLPRYSELLSHRSCPTLFCMLDTLSELDNESRFLEHGLAGWATQGDLLLLDFQVTPTANLETSELMKVDKLLAGGVPMEYGLWLGDLISRHNSEVESIQFTWEIETRTSLPGCYVLNAVATVDAGGRPARRFSMYRLKRYEPSALTACLSQLGWSELATLPYGSRDDPRSLCLFRRC